MDQTHAHQARQAIEAQLVAMAAKDENFRQELLHDPKGAIERVLGVKIPGYLTLHVHTESPTDLHLVLPAKVAASDELADSDLEMAAAADKSEPASNCVTYESGYTYCFDTRSVGGVRG